MPVDTQTTANLELWEKLNQPPPSALKPITGGRLKGKSDINPQWRYLALTEQFGPCGIGWKYTIDKLWLEPGSNGEVFAFARISLYVKSDGEWSDPIPGIGGSKLIQKEAGGLYNNDEAYKMTVTDALSVAFKVLGGAADIYMGLWDGSKYRGNGDTNRPSAGPVRRQPFRPGFESQQKESEINPTTGEEMHSYPDIALPPSGTKGINDVRAMLGHAQVLGMSEDEVMDWIERRAGKAPCELNAAQAKALLEAIKKEGKKNAA